MQHTFLLPIYETTSVRQTICTVAVWFRSLMNIYSLNYSGELSRHAHAMQKWTASSRYNCSSCEPRGAQGEHTNNISHEISHMESVEDINGIFSLM